MEPESKRTSRGPAIAALFGLVLVGLVVGHSSLSADGRQVTDERALVADALDASVGAAPDPYVITIFIVDSDAAACELEELLSGQRVTAPLAGGYSIAVARNSDEAGEIAAYLFHHASEMPYALAYFEDYNESVCKFGA